MTSELEDGPAGPVTHLLVDYGEVITTPQPEADLARLAELAGLDVATLVERYWRHRGEYDLGCSAATYWAYVLERPVENRDQLAALADADTASWCHLDARVLATLASVAVAGVRLTLLSNAPHELARRVRRMPAITDLFDDLLFSAELGIAKPDPAVFTTALHRTGTDPGDTLFVDDRQRNLAPAAALGMQTWRFTTADEFARTMARRVGQVD